MSVDAIRRYRRLHPQAPAGRIIADYADRIPKRAYRNACFYQRPGGCVLLREMRSDIRNNLYCSALQDFRYAAPETPTIRACFIVREPIGAYKTRLVQAKRGQDALHLNTVSQQRL